MWPCSSIQWVIQFLFRQHMKNPLSRSTSDDFTLLGWAFPVQHTSASLTINENYDSDVRDDTETFLSKIVPEVNFSLACFGRVVYLKSDFYMVFDFIISGKICTLEAYTGRFVWDSFLQIREIDFLIWFFSWFSFLKLEKEFCFLGPI